MLLRWPPLDIDRDILIRFPRNKELVEGQKDIDLELRHKGQKQRAQVQY